MDRFMVADLYGDVPLEKSRPWRAYLPGLTIVALATLAASFLSDHYGAPLTLMALLLGLSLNFLSSDRRMDAGLGLVSRSLLRWGIVLVGTRVTLDQIVQLGPMALLYVVVIMVATIGVGVLVARWLGSGTAFGILAGGAVAICGASAAMALATTLGKRRVSEAQLTIVLVGVSTMSAAAMLLYPVVAHALDLSDLQAGFFLGASIHDVAQALGAGYAFSDGAGGTAAVVKLTRVALLAPVLAAVLFLMPRGDADAPRGPAIPWFVVGFFLMAGFNSTGLIPTPVSRLSAEAATVLLTAAVAATAIRSPLPEMMATGMRPLYPIAAATVAAALLALAAALCLS